jgi:hypothetical protein
MQKIKYTCKETKSVNKNMSSTSTDLLETTLIGFTDMVNQFLTALTGVWPECRGIIDYLLKIDLAINHSIDPGTKRKAMESLIRRYHNSVQPLYGRCASR